MPGLFKKLFIIVLVFLIFYGGYLMISLSNNHESAYSSLKGQQKKKVKLQDTRVHNWSELQEKKE